MRARGHSRRSRCGAAAKWATTIRADQCPKGPATRPARRPPDRAADIIDRELFFHSAGDGTRGFLRLLARRAGSEPAHKIDEVIVTRVHAVARRKGDWCPQFDFRNVVKERQSLRHHAGDSEAFAAEFDLASDDRPVGAETPLPQTV